MGKKGKKIKWKNLPSTFRTCIIGTALFLVVGIGLIVFNLIAGGVSSDDIKTVSATIVSVNKVSSSLSSSQKEDLRKKGFNDDYINYELSVEYSFTVDGKEQKYSTRRPYENVDRMVVGNTDELKYAIEDGKVIVNPDRSFSYWLFGIIFIVLGVISSLAAYILRPKK